MKEWYTISNHASGVPEIYIYGILSPYPDQDTVSYSEFQAAFRSLSGLYQACNIRLNCMGGSILEGLAIYDMIDDSPMDTTTICEGVCASMAAIVFQAGKKRIMNKNSRLMIHRAQGGIHGDADSIRAYADQVESCEDSIKAILKAKTGLSDKEIDALMPTNIDTWITADDAVNKYHLADSIVQSPNAINLTPQNLAGKKPEEIYNLFYNEFKSPNINMNKLKASLIVLLAASGVRLSLDDSEDKFAEETEKLFNKKNEEITNIAKSNAEVIVNQAKDEGKITDEEVSVFVAMGTANPKGLVTMLGKLGKPAVTPVAPAPAGTTIVNINPNLKPGEGEVKDDRSKWTFKDYRENDPTALAAMEDTEPEKYRKLETEFVNSIRDKGWVK